MAAIIPNPNWNPISRPRTPPTPSIRIMHIKILTIIQWTSLQQKSNNEVLMATSLEKTSVNDGAAKLDRALQLTTTSVIVNKRITTPIILELRQIHGSSNLNVAKAHRNIFISMKMKDPTLKLVSNEVVIDTEL